MDDKKKEKIQKMISHPLEEFFDIEEGTTEIVRYDRKTIPKDYEDYDDKDAELEESYQEILDSAMSGFENLRDMIDVSDTKFAARLAEVGAQYLNTALAAANKKTQLKENKDKLTLRQKAGSGKNTTNNILVVDRNEALRMALEAVDKDSSEIIDAEVVDVKNNKTEE